MQRSSRSPPAVPRPVLRPPGTNARSLPIAGPTWKLERFSDGGDWKIVEKGAWLRVTGDRLVACDGLNAINAHVTVSGNDLTLRLVDVGAAGRTGAPDLRGKALDTVVTRPTHVTGTVEGTHLVLTNGTAKAEFTR